MECAVTGGSGFLGERIVELLLSERCPFPVRHVRVLDLKPPTNGENDGRTSYHRVDVRDRDQLRRALDGVELVFHAAAVVDWGRLPTELVEDVNVRGTQNVIDIMRALEIDHLIYTSTMDVAWEGKPVFGADETKPYAAKFTNDYCRTKAAAEALVLSEGRKAADSDQGPFTVVVRPMGMFGEADPYHCSQALLSVIHGKLSMRMGDGSARFAHVYVENVAWGHLCAAAKLLESPEDYTGEAYLIGDDCPPENFFDFMERFITGVGHQFPPKGRSISFRQALWIARTNTLVSRLMKPIRDIPPVVTSDSVRMLCLDMAFTDDKAREELDYRPIVDPDESIERTIAWFREHGPVGT